MARLVAKVLVASVGLICGAQAALAEPPGKTQEDVGETTYLTYCALCHGIGGAPGMFADALKKAAPDLTEIAKRNGGQFPEERVAQIIRDGGISGHGTMRLLSWEKYFRTANGGEQADQIIRDLTEYLKKQQTQ
jgi:mono/diheme cytochrome c family protein